MRKLFYLIIAWIMYLILLPFYDVVHIHSAGQTSAKRKLLFARLAHRCKKVVIVHFHPPGPDDIFKKESHDIVKKLFDLADKILVLSPQWIRWINEAFPDRNYLMETLWNPCPVVERRNNLRKPQILFAGTICKRKGYDVLLKAFGMIASKYPQWKLVFAGNPYLLDGIDELADGKKIASKVGITNQVEWLGWVSGKEKERVFQESSIYCLASEGEGFPMGVLDAWAYGIPCVMTPVGGIPDIVEDEKNGLLFPVGDVVKLSQKLDELISNSQLRLTIVQESDKWVYGEFCVKEVTNKLGAIYYDMLNQ